MSDPVVQSVQGETMGTFWSVRAVVPAALSLASRVNDLQAVLDLVDGQMSTYKPASALSRFNAAPGGTWHVLPAECFEVARHALQVARESDGAYDPTVGPLVNLWGFGPDAARREPPARDSIEAARERIGWWRIKLDAATHSLFQPGGIYLDLSSVAKGYAVDQVGQYLDNTGIASWLVEVGGELKGKGRKPDGSPWRIGIERPGAATGAVQRIDQLSQVVCLSGRAIATSGDYRRRFDAQGVTYSHHIDPRTGWPVPHAVASVSVLASEAMQADPLGTLMTVLGPEQGMACARKRGLAVMFILHGAQGLEERLSPAFEAALAS
ncbi:FAD:protein FMN transferase [Dyella japonica]|uniref:FAD:protein FMN transferase n=1 Tax=Dyella japonica A8 TaxID=1217721 RepID=A0A075K0U7_9GAMM|nr:FAD:protein FMN transferase [Dyella japonica]AIF47382.1 thiamine biosynthesis protein ApbE [Dyella japonica A8]